MANMGSNAWFNTTLVVAALAIILSSCGGSADEKAPSSTATPDLGAARPVTLSEAEALLDFGVTLPSFVPEGALSVPELSVLSGDDGVPYLLVAMYREDLSSPASARPLRMRLTELSGHASLWDKMDFEVVDIRGVPVEFAVGPFAGDFAEIAAAWSHNGVGIEAEFGWLSDHGDGVVTAQMRADALKVIESMIR